MKKAIQLISLIILHSSIMGCATSGYLTDRAQDAADIFTAGIGFGVGGKARVGPIQTGLLFDAPLGALRGGEFTKGNKGYVFPDPLDVQVVAFGLESFTMIEPQRRAQRGAQRGKEFYASTGANSLVIPFIHRVERTVIKRKIPYYYYTQCEAVIGIGLSVRLGLNPGELLDFLLGWMTFNIFNDDLERRKMKGNSKD